MSEPEGRRFSILHPLWLAPLGSRALLEDVGRRWRGFGIIYLHLLVALVWLPVSIKKQVQLNHFVQNEAPAAFEDFPELSIYNGKLRTDAEGPRSWNDPQSGLPMLLVDTSGQITSLQGREERVLLTVDRMYVSQGQIAPREYKLNRMSGLYLDKVSILELLDTANLWFFVLYFPTAFVLSICWQAAFLVLYAMAGAAMARARGAELPFAACMRLAAMAITPVLLIELVFDMVGWAPPLWGLMTVAICVGYMARGVAVTVDR